MLSVVLGSRLLSVCPQHFSLFSPFVIGVKLTAVHVVAVSFVVKETLKGCIIMNVVTDIHTNPPSRPLNQPSHTYFSIPYTGAFTKVSSISEHSELKKESEKTPLIMHE